jgi:hypothetical protein
MSSLVPSKKNPRGPLCTMFCAGGLFRSINSHKDHLHKRVGGITNHQVGFFFYTLQYINFEYLSLKMFLLLKAALIIEID